jgi:hypothetical protein
VTASTANLTRAMAVAIVAAAALFAAGCQSAEEPADAAPPTTDGSAAVADVVEVTEPDQTLRFVARDYSFAGPTTATAGLTELMLENEGAEDHQLALFRLDDGVEAGTVLAALGEAGNLEAGREYGEWIAGPNGVSNGASVSVVTTLEPGQYIVGCLIPSPDGTPHAMKGMLAALTVSEASAPSAPTTGPEAETADSALPRISLHDYHVMLPDGFDGSGPIEVVNEGDEVHELAIARLADGATANDVVDYETSPRPHSAPAPYALVTGTSFIDPGRTGRLDLDLAPGEYVALCFIPAPSGEAHLALGMVHPFTVT